MLGGKGSVTLVLMKRMLQIKVQSNIKTKILIIGMSVKHMQETL